MVNGSPFPVSARKRCVFVIKPQSIPEGLSQAGLTVDTSGVYFRPEGATQFICGTCPPSLEDPDVDYDDFEVDHSIFENYIWPALAARVPAFEAIKVVASWAGHYAYNTMDQNAILGAHPEVDNFYFANGFSGHGMQQSPAVGRGMSELILEGKYTTLDLSPLGYDRILNERPLFEKNIV